VPCGGVSVADVEDVARTIADALVRGRAGERYLLGGHNLQYREFYALLARGMGLPPPTRRGPPILPRAPALGFGVLGAPRLSRPPFSPEIYRAWGWYLYSDSSKAQRELGYEIRPLAEIIERTVGRR